MCGFVGIKNYESNEFAKLIIVDQMIQKNGFLKKKIFV